MARTAHLKPDSLKSMLEQIKAAGHMSRQDYMTLTSAALADVQMAEAERRDINLIFDYVQIGRLKLVD